MRFDWCTEMKRTRVLVSALALACVVVLPACGGGGGGDSNDAQTTRLNTKQGQVGGAVSGLSASSDALVITDAITGDSATVPGGATTFALPRSYDYQSSYQLSITQQPASQACVLVNGSGLVGVTSATAVTVSCTSYAAKTALKAHGDLAAFWYLGAIGGMVRDKLGYIYLSDTHNNAIRRLSPSGRVALLWVSER